MFERRNGGPAGGRENREREQRVTRCHPTYKAGEGKRELGWAITQFPLATFLWEKIQSSEAVNNKALFLHRVDDESASVYENLNIKSPKVSGMSNTGR